MKKIYIVLLCLLMITGCMKQEDEISDNIQVQQINDEIITDRYVDDNPIIVGLYQNGKLVTELDTKIKAVTDIASFDVYFTNEIDVGSSNTKRNFLKYYDNYDNIDKYKIGFYINFYNTDGILIEGIIKSPSDLYLLSPYIYNYLYDDVHQEDNTFYSHVEEDEVNDDTIYSSIKLFAVEDDKINSPITLMVFTYDDDNDFDEFGYYRGNSKYTITININ